MLSQVQVANRITKRISHRISVGGHAEFDWFGVTLLRSTLRQRENS